MTPADWQLHATAAAVMTLVRAAVIVAAVLLDRMPPQPQPGWLDD